MRLEGRAAIITGAGRGIGRAIALEASSEGALVALAGRTEAELKETAGLIGSTALAIKCDVSRPPEVEAAVKRAGEAFGRIDILVNNAAVRGPVMPVHKVAVEDWAEAIAVNIGGAFLFSRAVVPMMTRQGGGKIINITSGLADMVLPPLGVYSITKAALNHMTRIMAEELKGHNIQVNAIDPGAVDTRMQEELRKMGPGVLGEEVYAEFLALKESGYILRPEAPARLVVFLASSESDHITGETGSEAEYIRLGYAPPEGEG